MTRLDVVAGVDLVDVTTYQVWAVRGDRHRKVGECPTAEAAEGWAATERQAMKGWRTEIRPVTAPHWVRTGDMDLVGSPPATTNQEKDHDR